MKYILVLLVAVGGCSTQKENEPCQVYEEVPSVSREYLRYPMRGYVETTTTRMVCVG